jgi:hypothetical protein
LNELPTNSFHTWSGSSAAFDADTNQDGITNGMAWILGASNPTVNALEKLPIATANGNYLRLTFRCLKSTQRGTTALTIQSSSDMGVTDPWNNHSAAVPDASSTINGVIFQITDDGDFIQVTADIPSNGSRIFARLKMEMTAS